MSQIATTELKPITNERVLERQTKRVIKMWNEDENPIEEKNENSSEKTTYNKELAGK